MEGDGVVVVEVSAIRMGFEPVSDTKPARIVQSAR